MKRRLLVVSILFAGIIVFVLPVRPEPRWDHDPNVVVLELACVMCGEVLSSPYLYVADVRIFGDGRILWKEGTALRAGQLTDQEVERILHVFIEHGFFSHDLTALNIFKMANYTLTLQLRETTKTRAWTYDDPSEEEQAMIRSLFTGAGVTGHAFEPQQGQIKVQGAGPHVRPQHHWPADQFGYQLEDGMVYTISGAELAFVWPRIQDDGGASIESGGQSYLLFLNDIR